MEMDWIWKSILIVVGGTLLLRIAGRKSISQMTLAQTVIMIAIGSLLIQPVAGKNIWVTFGVGGILILTLIVMEYGQIKGNWLEKIITGKSKVLIENGNLNINTLRKLRLTVDQLEMQLRQKNVSKISDVKYATLEPNGQLGFTLKEDAQTSTVKHIRKLEQDILELKELINTRLPHVKLITEQAQSTNEEATKLKNKATKSANQNDIFQEVDTKSHTNPPPKNLH
jgi:uncharacterized membrane protein YcaP (DUF421 family)